MLSSKQFKVSIINYPTIFLTIFALSLLFKTIPIFKCSNLIVSLVYLYPVYFFLAIIIQGKNVFSYSIF